LKRVFKKSAKFSDAEEWDILQHIKMSPEERQAAAWELRRRVYGNRPDVREAERKK
jgi:hypothetical protein